MKLSVLKSVLIFCFIVITFSSFESINDDSSIYDCEKEFSEGLAVACIEDKYGNRKYGYINKSKKIVIPFIYEFAYSFSYGRGLVYKEDEYGIGKYGYIDKTGKEVTPLKYDKAAKFLGGYAIVEVNQKQGLINKAGNEIVPLIYDEVRNRYKYRGIAIVWLQGKMGVFK